MEGNNAEQVRQYDDIQLKDFIQIHGLDGVCFIAVQDSGEGAKVAPKTVASSLISDIRPSIDTNGYWFIGKTETGVLAKAQTPVLTSDGSLVQWKYDIESNESYRVLADLANFVFKFDDLTDEQRDKLSLHYNQLTPEEIAQLQKPATDTISTLNTTNTQVTEAETGRTMAENARVAQEKVRQQQETARQTNTATAISNAVVATSNAQEVAENATYIGSDYYVYEYNLATHCYNKTDKMMKVAGFRIDEQYTSVADLMAHQPAGKMDNLLAIVNSSNTEDEDNAKLYISKGGKWQYVVDMSGFRGFRGYTPQILIGAITVGSNRTDSAASLTDDGKDADGNPKYKLNIRIPSFSFSDLTADQIAQLQKPATDAAATVNTATANANTATANANTATAASKVQTDLAQELNEHPQKQGDNGNWWRWNTATKAYEDTGIVAKGTQGDKGIGFTIRGQWQSGRTYNYFDVVRMNGSSFVCISKSGTQNPPFWTYTAKDGNRVTTRDNDYLLTGNENSTEWELLARAGDSGKGSLVLSVTPASIIIPISASSSSSAGVISPFIGDIIVKVTTETADSTHLPDSVHTSGDGGWLKSSAYDSSTGYLTLTFEAGLSVEKLSAKIDVIVAANGKTFDGIINVTGVQMFSGSDN